MSEWFSNRLFLVHFSYTVIGAYELSHTPFLWLEYENFNQGHGGI